MTEENQNYLHNLSNLILNNKKLIFSFLFLILLLLFSYFFYIDYKRDIKVQISEKYNLAIINYNKDNPSFSISEMKDVINSKDSTYSPLALYFLLDNNLLKEKKEINNYFDNLIYDVNLEDEIKNLIIYKKGLYNSSSATENELLEIFKPLINKDSMWKSHALYVIAEYFYSKNEKMKSKEFFEKILETKNSNSQIKLEAQKRLRRDFSA
tara:strand:- start:6938 stop:7567 length:630 start_codon:yes stop_codon:yes gene_type:complete